MVRACDLDPDSACTLDEAIKTALTVAGLQCPIWTGGLAQVTSKKEVRYPYVVIESFAPTDTVNSGCGCAQADMVVQFRITSTNSNDGIDVANRIKQIMRPLWLQSRQGNARWFSTAVPNQTKTGSGTFLTLLNLRMVVSVPQ